MNEIELTKLFVEYKETAEKLKELEISIRLQVLSLAESQRIAGVRATYYAPSVEYDYEAMAHQWAATEENIQRHITVQYTRRWKDIAEEAGAYMTDPEFAIEKPARVVVKV